MQPYRPLPLQIADLIASVTSDERLAAAVVVAEVADAGIDEAPATTR
ncbi:MAG TPA: hypothetical protein VFP66_10270 [Candidatus Limnocylindrales bacterium]|nr:hypothetical protein [Candidatus Limnocylindrales bacterium]